MKAQKKTKKKTKKKKTEKKKNHNNKRPAPNRTMNTTKLRHTIINQKMKNNDKTEYAAHNKDLVKKHRRTMDIRRQCTTT